MLRDEKGQDEKLNAGIGWMKKIATLWRAGV
jgi:hypothetical protein